MRGLRLARERGAYTLSVAEVKRTGAGQVALSNALRMSGSIRSGMNRVSARLASFDYPDFSEKELFASATYTLRKPGKMLRPALVFLGAQVIGRETDAFVDMAAAAELLHTASLVHDDIIDRDTVRRGVPALHARYGRETALLAGDALIAKAVSLAARYGPGVVKTVADASLDTCAGELLDYTFQRDGRMPSVREYLRIARLKNGVFMGTCSSIAATYARSRKAGRLYAFGLNLGVAFQIRDDIIEMVDAGERVRNGGAAKRSPNLVSIFERQFRIGNEEALGNAVELNNYFADRALGFVKGEKAGAELASYIDFVRIRDT